MIALTIPISGAIEPDFVVDFQANTTIGPAPLTVQFQSLATGAPVIWIWGIDNQLINESSPVYTFTRPGSYTINLSVTDENDITLNETKLNYITVNSSVEYASISFLSSTVWGSNPVQIIDKSTGKPVPGEYNTSSRDIHLDPNHDYTVMVEPSGVTDLANSGDYAATKFATNARQNLIGIGIILFMAAFFVTRKKT
jgi:PKD repeat protein